MGIFKKTIINNKMEKYIAYIRNNETNEIRRIVQYTLIEHDIEWGTPEFLIFMWTDGNYGCDCNRQLFFRTAGGECMEDCVKCKYNCECGEGHYSVNLEDITTGEIFYREFNDLGIIPYYWRK